MELGAKIEVPLAFDPTKGNVIANTESRFHKPPGLSAEEEDKYDPTKVSDMVAFLKKQRES